MTERRVLRWELPIPVDDGTAGLPCRLGHAPAFPSDIGVEQELRMAGQSRLHLAAAAVVVAVAVENKGCLSCCKAESASWPWRP